jgi:hypothetical protein
LVIARESEGENVRRSAVQRECDEDARLETRMAGVLFTTRLREQAAALIEWRARLFDDTEPLRAEALQWVPDTVTGRGAPEPLASMSKSDRLRGAGYRALHALTIDPLDDELVWVAAHAADFLYGAGESKPWYDRYLALHGIRSHDHRTYSGRQLDLREREALDAVQRSVVPMPGRPRGF